MTDQRAKPRRRWLQFSLRTLLIAVTLATGLLVAWRAYVEPYRRQRETMKLIKELGGSYKTEPGGPAWMRDWFGAEQFQDIVLVDLADCDAPDKYLGQIVSLPRLETLVVGGWTFTDEHVSRLEKLATIRKLVLDSTDVSDDGIGELKRMLPKLAIHKSQRRAIEIVRRFEKYTDNHAVTDTWLFELARMALATKKGRTAGMSAIIRSLSHDDPKIKRSALESLDQCDTPIEALEPLTELLVDSDVSIRWQARESLCSLGSRARSALPNLKKSLSTSEEYEFINILVTMCAIAPKDMLVVSSLLEVASNKDQSLPKRRAAVVLLGGVGRSEKKVIQALLDLHPEPKLRFWVTQALFRLAPERKEVTAILLDEIRRAPDDLDFLIRDHPSGKGLERAKYFKYLNEFQRIMVERKGISGISVAAAVLQIDRKNQRARQELEDALLYGDADRQRYAADATSALQIRLVNPQIVAKLIKRIDEKDAVASYSVFIDVLGLTRSSDGSALRTLQSCLTDEWPIARKAAALALVRVDQKRHARPAIVKYLRQTSNHYYVATAQELLLIAKAYEATDIYVKSLVAMLDLPLHRIHALRSLSEIGPDAKTACSRLIRLLDDPSAEVQQRSIEILGEIGNGARNAIPRLRELQRDKDMFVRWQAEDAILKISAESNDD